MKMRGCLDHVVPCFVPTSAAFNVEVAELELGLTSAEVVPTVHVTSVPCVVSPTFTDEAKSKDLLHGKYASISAHSLLKVCVPDYLI
jgi:hypothetical protein